MSRPPRKKTAKKRGSPANVQLLQIYKLHSLTDIDIDLLSYWLNQIRAQVHKYSYYCLSSQTRFVFHLLFSSSFKFCLDQTPPERVVQDVQWLRESGLFSQDQVDVRVSYIQVFSYLMFSDVQGSLK